MSDYEGWNPAEVDGGDFSHVFQPLAIGPVTSRNRIEVSPAEPFLCTRDGLVTDEFIAFTVAMARGGAGIVTVGDSPVTQEYADANHYVVNLADPFVVHGLFKLAEGIHRYGALASIELNLRAEFLPADLTVAEILGIQDAFASAAERCAKAGFDMVMVHGGHGHTVAQFYSPWLNKRTDRYGTGTFENRCRFASELLDKVREAIGPTRAIELRMSGDEKIAPEHNVGLEDAVLFAEAIQEKVDLLHVSAGSLYDVAAIDYMIQSTYQPHATNLELARRIRAAVNVPVTTVGSYTMDLAEKALTEGVADMVAMIRPFIADPDQVNKAKAGKAADIRPCLRCNLCTGDDPHGCPKPLRCSVNAIAGRQPEFDRISRAPVSKNVVVVGGGCAGLEAARRLVERGHEVVLFEKEEKLGGSLRDAGRNLLKADVRRYAAWSMRTVEQDSRIQVHTGMEATPDLIAAQHPDAVILAVGSTPNIPRIPGVDRDIVMTNAQAETAPEKVGRRLLVVGAGLTGSETALMFAQMGREVIVADMATYDELAGRDRKIAQVHERLKACGATLRYGHGLARITGEGAALSCPDGTEMTVTCDTVVLSLGVHPRTDVLAALRDVCPDTRIIGDCNNRAGNIATAVREAFFAAMDV